MNNILNKYIFYVTCWTLNLLENRSHKSKVVFQIWGWYLKKSAFSKILFGALYQIVHIRCQQNSAGAHSGWICDIQ